MTRKLLLSMVVFLLTSLLFSTSAFAKKRGAVIVIENMGSNPISDFLAEYVAVFIYKNSIKSSYKNNYFLVNSNATESKMKDKIKYAARKNDQVDVYTLVHGSQNGMFLHLTSSQYNSVMNGGAMPDNSFVDKDEIKSLKGNKLRFIYQMNCWGSYLNSSWRYAGAKSVLGSTKINVLPFAYYPMFVHLFKKRSIKIWYLARSGWWWKWKSKNLDTSWFLYPAAAVTWNFAKNFESTAISVSGINSSDVNSYKKRSGSAWIRVTSN